MDRNDAVRQLDRKCDCTQPKPGPYISNVTVPAYTLVPTYIDVDSGHTSGY